MSDLDKHIQDLCESSPEFKAEFEAEMALFELVRARQRANLTQSEVAEAMNVSQPYIAQIENGTRSPSMGTMFRYASAIGAKFQIVAESKGTGKKSGYARAKRAPEKTEL